MRHLRLYLHFLRFSFSRAMEFRLDFFFRIAMDTLWNAVHFAFFVLLFLHTDAFGGLSEDQIYIFAGAVFFADAVQMTVVSNNLWMFPYLVNRGDLDYYLTRPVSPLFFVSLRDFAANSFLNLLLAIGILVWTIARYPADLGAGALILFFVMALLGCFLHYVLSMMFLIPVFWIHRGEGLRQIFWSLDSYSQRPSGIFTGWARRILLSVLPMALVISMPVYTLFDGATWLGMVHFLGIIAAAFVGMVFFWRRGLRAYSSASS